MSQSQNTKTAKNKQGLQEQDLYDITTAAAAAEAEILERAGNDAEKAKAMKKADTGPTAEGKDKEETSSTELSSLSAYPT